MVFTIEPGIYLPDEKLGVSIEDVVLVDETGAKILSDGLAREPDAIEKRIATRSTSASPRAP